MTEIITEIITKPRGRGRPRKEKIIIENQPVKIRGRPKLDRSIEDTKQIRNTYKNKWLHDEKNKDTIIEYRRRTYETQNKKYDVYNYYASLDGDIDKLSKLKTLLKIL